MKIDFQTILNDAISPLVLISGVGLILLSLINRYNQAISRTRGLIAEARGVAGSRAEALREQIAILMKRCRILKLSIGFVVGSLILSSCIIVTSILASLTHVDAGPFQTFLLLGSCLCIVVSNVFLLIDVMLSLKALKIEART